MGQFKILHFFTLNLRYFLFFSLLHIYFKYNILDCISCYDYFRVLLITVPKGWKQSIVVGVSRLVLDFRLFSTLIFIQV